MCDSFRLNADDSAFDANGLRYAAYMTYNERAANNCVGSIIISRPDNWYHDVAAGCYALMQRALLVKYPSNRVQQGEKVDIKSTLATNDDEMAQALADDEQLILHEWRCEERIVHSCLVVYRLVANMAGYAATLSGARTPDIPTSKRILAMRREAASSTIPQSLAAAAGVRAETFDVFPDMLSSDGLVAMAAMLSLLDRHRTSLLGGWVELARLKREEGTRPLVYRVCNLKLGAGSGSAVTVRPTDEVRVASALQVQNEMFATVSQTATHVLTGACLASAHFKLAFVRGEPGEEAVVKAPEAIRARCHAADPDEHPVVEPTAAKEADCGHSTMEPEVWLDRSGVPVEIDPTDPMRSKLLALCVGASVCGF